MEELEFQYHGGIGMLQVQRLITLLGLADHQSILECGHFRYPWSHIASVLSRADFPPEPSLQPQMMPFRGYLYSYVLSAEFSFFCVPSVLVCSFILLVQDVGSYWVPVSALSQGSEQDFYDKRKPAWERELWGRTNRLVWARFSCMFL